MTVVSNTSPLNYLLCIDAVDVLPQLYGAIAIPEAVRQELSASRAPQSVREWMSVPPAWITVHEAQPVESARHLDVGEAEAISLALQWNADLVLLDDLAARSHAKLSGLAVVGTLGILGTAADRGLVDLVTSIKRLQETTFQARQELYDAVLARRR